MFFWGHNKYKIVFSISEIHVKSGKDLTIKGLSDELEEFDIKKIKNGTNTHELAQFEFHFALRR